MSRSGGQDKQRYINTFIIHAYIYTFKTLNLCLEKKRKEEVEERNQTGAKRTRPAEISAGVSILSRINPPPPPFENQLEMFEMLRLLLWPVNITISNHLIKKNYTT